MGRFEEINDLIYKHDSFVIVRPFIFGLKCTTVYCSKLEYMAFCLKLIDVYLLSHQH